MNNQHLIQQNSHNDTAKTEISTNGGSSTDKSSSNSNPPKFPLRRGSDSNSYPIRNVAKMTATCTSTDKDDSTTDQDVTVTTSSLDDDETLDIPTYDVEEAIRRLKEQKEGEVVKYSSFSKRPGVALGLVLLIILLVAVATGLWLWLGVLKGKADEDQGSAFSIQTEVDFNY